MTGSSRSLRPAIALRRASIKPNQLWSFAAALPRTHPKLADASIFRRRLHDSLASSLMKFCASRDTQPESPPVHWRTLHVHPAAPAHTPITSEFERLVISGMAHTALGKLPATACEYRAMALAVRMSLATDRRRFRP